MKSNLIYNEELLAGKNALVTGGASGLGRSIAVGLSQVGANVIIVSRQEEVLAKAAKEISDETDREITYDVVDIRDIEMDISKIEKPEIELTDEIGIKLNFPDLELVQKFIKPGGDLATNDIFNLINECIEYIWDGDEIFKAKDATRKELTDFVESLSTEQFTKIRNYFESMTSLRHEITWKCPKCDKTAPLVLEGLDSFFG